MKNAMTIGCLALFAAGTAFAAPDAIRVTDCCGDVWRIQTAVAPGRFENRGAVQVFKDFLGEKHEDRASAPSRGRVTKTEGGDWRVTAPDGRLLAEFGAPARTADGRLALTFKLAEGEAVYGGGCRFDAINKRGTEFRLRAEDGWNRSDTMYQPTPFFTTSRGVGIYLNTFSSMTIDAGKTNPGEWTIAVDGDTRLDVYVFACGTISQSVEAFQKFVGVAPAPRIRPGPIVCRYHARKDFNSFEKVRRIYDEHVKAGMKPAALIVEPYPITKAYGDTKVRADLDAMAAFFRKEDVPLLIWSPCGSVIYPKMPGFREEYIVHCDVFTNGILKAAGTTDVPALFENGVKNPDISTWYRHPPMLDVTNPEARDWFEKNVLKFLADHFILGAKLDFCEFMADEGRVYGKDRVSVRYHWKDPSVFGGQSVHHAYPCFFNLNFYRSLKRAAGGRDDVFVFCRGGGGLGDFRTPWYWAGDQARTFNKLQDQVRAVLSSRLSGIPYMSYDMAGYAGPPKDLATEGRVFARGVEFTKFMPLMQTHGDVANFFEFSPEVQKIYSDAVAFHGKNKAPVRPLVECWSDDPNVRSIDDEFLFGDDLLVAPVFDDTNARTVYLPAGEWRNELTGEKLEVGAEGRTVSVKASLAEIPSFRKKKVK